MHTIQQKLQDIRKHITIISQDSIREPEAVTMLVVSKNKPVEVVAEAIAAGQYKFGENYVQEGVSKIQYFTALPDIPALEWHFIGSLQANKSRLVAEYFDWCQTVDRIRIAERLNDQRPDKMAPLNVLIQINISNEHSKSGIVVNDLLGLAKVIIGLPKLMLRGLMVIPMLEVSYFRQLAVFRQMNDAFLMLRQLYPQVDTLSMGMTNDMAAAIAAGSTMVRIGTAIFGNRNHKSPTQREECDV